MSGVLFLIPVSIIMGLLGLAAFLWSLRHRQFEDLDGDAGRILTAPDQPITLTAKEKTDG
uniref:cbb3-type cytochrome oxidase assembly protein CcoS n=1 Tax=Pararhizobium sp. IMCC3301 TaxID=3067904 RepID=UPI002740B41D|nr:cbb3-type cytochrome oxidase assembly protein CcoS [Pararhizobium sp. IMCC3301]